MVISQPSSNWPVLANSLSYWIKRFLTETEAGLSEVAYRLCACDYRFHSLLTLKPLCLKNDVKYKREESARVYT